MQTSLEARVAGLVLSAALSPAGLNRFSSRLVQPSSIILKARISTLRCSRSSCLSFSFVFLHEILTEVAEQGRIRNSGLLLVPTCQGSTTEARWKLLDLNSAPLSLLLFVSTWTRSNNNRSKSLEKTYKLSNGSQNGTPKCYQNMLDLNLPR